MKAHLKSEQRKGMRIALNKYKELRNTVKIFTLKISANLTST